MTTVSLQASLLIGRQRCDISCIFRALAPASGGQGKPRCWSQIRGLSSCCPPPSPLMTPIDIMGDHCRVDRDCRRKKRKMVDRGGERPNAIVYPKDLRRDHVFEIFLPFWWSSLIFCQGMLSFFVSFFSFICRYIWIYT